MRRDALGLFWRDEPVVKVLKEKKLVRPPKPTWLDADYLPGLTAAREWLLRNPFLTDQELIDGRGGDMDFDIEVYRNYFLAMFKCRRTGKYVYIESNEDGYIDTNKLGWILINYTTIGFNSLNYDMPITSIALAGYPCSVMKDASDRIIVGGEQWRDILRGLKVKRLECDHIDLIEVAPLRGSLKAYNGRFHGQRMQDLPFNPDVILSKEQIDITRYYCANDLDATWGLSEVLTEQIKLRIEMGKQYDLDLRSKSDAQIAEHVISSEVENLLGKRVSRPKIPPGTAYRFKTPHYLQFQSPLLRYALDVVERSAFIVADHGSIEMPPEVDALKLEINKSTYQMGIGGLHSTEKKCYHLSDDEYELYDYDVTGFYPRIILNQGLFPYHMGPGFLRVYNRIVETRVAAKKRKEKVIANSLKIVVNGSYGKLGSKWSNLYAPDLLVQVTLTGQLSLLLLIERLELTGIQVVSANTDGIVIKPHKSQVPAMQAIVAQWEKDTRFELEGTQYRGIFSRDVNTYLAVKMDGGVKTKGAFANPWNQDEDKSEWLHKNPTNSICVEAFQDFLTKGIPIARTITQCRDIKKFVSVRAVTGGAVKVWGTGDEAPTEYLGKTIRWYYAQDLEGYMVYAKSGKKVPRSDGAKPCMDLPRDFPIDVDFEWYIAETEKMLKQVGYV